MSVTQICYSGDPGELVWRGLLDRFLNQKQKLKHRMGHFIQVPGQTKTHRFLSSSFIMFHSHALRIWLPHRCPNSDLPTSDSPAARSIRPLCHGQRCGLLGGNAVAKVAGEQADAVHLPGQWSQLPGDRWAPSLDSITSEPTFSFRNVFVCKKKKKCKTMKPEQNIFLPSCDKDRNG